MLHNDKILNTYRFMPRIGLGVWQAKNGKEVESAVESALNAGYRLFDTAAAYGNEASVGKAITSSVVPREEIFVTTKLWNADHGYDKTLKACDKSLKRLGLDYIDLFLMHWPAPEAGNYTDTWRAFEKLKKDGKVRSIGVSNFTPDLLDSLIKNSSVVPAVNQIELHPRFTQQATVEYCQNHGIAVEAYSPLGGAGNDLLKDATLQEIAKSHSASTAQIIIRWHLQRDHIVIPKSTSPKRIAQNIDVYDFSLNDEEMATIDGLDTGERVGANPEYLNIMLPTRLVQFAHRFGLVHWKKK